MDAITSVRVGKRSISRRSRREAHGAKTTWHSGRLLLFEESNGLLCCQRTHFSQYRYSPNEVRKTAKSWFGIWLLRGSCGPDWIGGHPRRSRVTLASSAVRPLGVLDHTIRVFRTHRITVWRMGLSVHISDRFHAASPPWQNSQLLLRKFHPGMSGTRDGGIWGF